MTSGIFLTRLYSFKAKSAQITDRITLFTDTVAFTVIQKIPLLALTYEFVFIAKKIEIRVYKCTNNCIS